MDTERKVVIKLPTDLVINPRGDHKHTIATIKEIVAMVVNTAKKKDGLLKLLCLVGKNKYDLKKWYLANEVKYDEEYEYDIRDILEQLCHLVVTIGKYKYPSTLGGKKRIEKTLNKIVDMLVINSTLDHEYRKEIIAGLESIASEVLGMVNYQYNENTKRIELCWISKHNEFITDYFITPLEDGNVQAASVDYMNVTFLIRYLEKIKSLANGRNDKVIDMIFGTNATDAILDKNKSAVNEGIIKIIGNTANDMLSKQLRGLYNLAKKANWLILYPNSRVNYKKFIKSILKHRDISNVSKEVYNNVVEELMDYLSGLTYGIYYRMDGIKLVLYIDSRWCYTKDLDYKDMK
jgi:hypothetical protein